MHERVLTSFVQGRKVRLLSALSALLLALPLFVFAALPFQPKGFVNDFAGVLTTEEHSSLETKLSQFEVQSGVEIAVVVIPSLDGDTVENVAVEVFKRWGIGKKGQDNGLLLLVAQEDRKLRIEVGYGLEGTVTDIFANGVVNQIIVPEFKVSNFGGGITKGVDALVSKISGEEVSVVENTSGVKINYSKLFEFLLFGIPYMIFVMAATPSWWFGGALGFVAGFIALMSFGSTLYSASGGILIVGLTLFGFLFDFIVSKIYGRAKKSGVHPPWWLGGGGFGGGFGGFGGGMSGGGGSSGRW